MKKMDLKKLWVFIISLIMTANLIAQQANEFCIYSTTLINATDTADMIAAGYLKNNLNEQSISFVEIKMQVRSETYEIDTLMHLKLELKDMKLPDSTFIARDIESQKMFELDVFPGNDKSKKTFMIKDKQHTWFFYAVAANWFTKVAKKEPVEVNNFDPELKELNLHDTIIDYAAYQDRNNETVDWSEIKPHKLTINYNVNGLRDVALLYPDTTLYLKYLDGSYFAERDLKYSAYLNSQCSQVLIERKTNNSPTVRNLNSGYVFRLFSESAIREAMEDE